MHTHRTLLTAICIGLFVGVASVFVYRPSPQTPVEKASSLTKVAADASPMQIQVTIDQKSEGTRINKHLWGINYDHFSDLNKPPFDRKESNIGFKRLATNTSKASINTNDTSRLSSSSSLSFHNKSPSLLRFPGGCGSESYDWKTGKITLRNPKTNEFYETTGGTKLQELIEISKNKFDIVYTINMDIYGDWNACGGAPEFKTYPYPLHKQTNLSRTELQEELKRQLLSDAISIAQQFGSRISYFELGNELGGPINNTHDLGMYFDLAIEFARQLKWNAPTAKVLVQTGPFEKPESPWRSDIKNAFIRRGFENISCDLPGGGKATCFDYIQAHWYSYVRVFGSNEPLPLSNSTNLYQVGRLGFSPIWDISRKVPSYSIGLPLAVTEWSLTTENTEESYNATENMDSAFYQFETLMSYIAAKIPISIFHNMNSLRWIAAAKLPFYLTSILQDGSLLQTSSTGVPTVLACYPDCANKNTFPLVTAYTGRSNEGELYVFIANHSDDKAAVLNFSGIEGYNAAEAVTIYTNDGYGNKNGSVILTKTEQLSSLKNVTVNPVTITRLQLKKGAAQPQSPLTCNINILNQNIRPQNLSGVPPKFTMNKSALKKGPQLSNTFNDIKLDTAPPSSNTQYAMSLHIRTTNAGDWWDRITPENVFKERANAIGTTHAAYLQNLEPGTYEIACNAILLNAEGKETATACSGAVPEGQVTDGPNNARYTKCAGTSLIQLEITTPTPNEQPPSVPPTTAPAANPLTPTLTGVPSATLPPSFTIKEHLFVQMPSENNAKPIYRDYKNFTLMLQNQDEKGQKVFCTKNLDTQEFEPKEKVPGLSCTQAHQVMLENPVTREQKLYHQFTIHMSLNPFNETLYKQWERYRFYWGVGMDPEEAQNAIKAITAANYPRSINSTDLAQGYHEEKILIQE